MQKNVIWLLCDQLRGDALAINGDPNAHTPHIDQLALTGVNFPNAVSGSPLCCPYRGSLLTGLYPHQSSVARHEERLDPGITTAADLFNQAGFETTYLGKWHLAGIKEQDNGVYTRAAKEEVPKAERGRFDTWIGYDNNNDPFDCWLHGHDGERDVPLYRLDEYETDGLTSLACQRIAAYGRAKAAGQGNPFFMVISVQPPHDPYVGPADNMGHFKEAELTLRGNVPPYPDVERQARRDLRGMYAMLENIDTNVGRLMRALREADLDDDTYVVFFSDHGDAHGSHGYERKMSMFEESVRIPFIVSQGKRQDYDRGWLPHQSSALVNHVDVLPTSMGLAGLDVPDSLPGYDYSGYLCVGHEPGPDEPTSAYLQIIDPPSHGKCARDSWRGVVTRDGWKYAAFEDGDWGLYNLAADPLELVNLAPLNAYREKRRALRALLQRWIDTTQDPGFQLPPDS